MKTKSRKLNIPSGFSLVEVLMVIVVISILISLLIPALGAVQKMALNMKQRAQFATIEIGLEGFSNDFGDYPPSGSNVTFDTYTGAQRLAEAMVGLDGYGFHKDSQFVQDGTDGATTPTLLYDVNNTMTQAQKDISWARRKDLYLELESANAVSLTDLALTGPGIGSLYTGTPTLVLADQFKKVKNNRTGKLTGSPILYFRPNPNLPNVFDITDCWFMASAVGLTTALDYVSGSDPVNAFANLIQNPNFVGNRPYRSESFILMSAGPDGIFGTADDVYNFNSDK